MVLILAAISCQKDEIPQQTDDLYPISNLLYLDNSPGAKKAANVAIEVNTQYLDEINSVLSEAGKNYRAVMAELFLNPEHGLNEDKIISQDVGNKQLDADFIPSDFYRIEEGWGMENGITYAIHQTFLAVPSGGLLTQSDADEAIERATSTWDNVRCANIGLTRVDDQGLILGAAIGGAVVADIMHCGFLGLPPDVLGLTITFIWIDDVTGEPTDMDNNNKADVAFREIYYSSNYVWSNDGTSGVDLETVSAHELGHGLSQAHFGIVHPYKPGWFKINPRALMNPFYFDVYRDLAPTDVAGHCSIWGNWPNN